MYVKNFQKAGYDDTTFLLGMKEQDLVDIGIENRDHCKNIIAAIETLPRVDIDQNSKVSKLQ